jgi:hypothetical protein
MSRSLLPVPEDGTSLFNVPSLLAEIGGVFDPSEELSQPERKIREKPNFRSRLLPAKLSGVYWRNASNGKPGHEQLVSLHRVCAYVPRGSDRRIPAAVYEEGNFRTFASTSRRLTPERIKD